MAFKRLYYFFCVIFKRRAPSYLSEGATITAHYYCSLVIFFLCDFLSSFSLFPEDSYIFFCIFLLFVIYFLCLFFIWFTSFTIFLVFFIFSSWRRKVFLVSSVVLFGTCPRPGPWLVLFFIRNFAFRFITINGQYFCDHLQQ